MSIRTPYNTGFCDAMFRRPCKSPYSLEGWGAIRKNAEYINGYMRGEEIRDEGTIDGAVYNALVAQQAGGASA